MRMECVVYEVGTQAILMIQMNFSFQRATLGSAIVFGLKQAIRISGTQREADIG